MNAPNQVSDVTKWDMVSLGEPMIEFSAIPGADGHYLQGFGGDTMNAIIAAARQGSRVAYITRIGDDDFGRMLRALWEREGVDQQGVSLDADAPTAVYFVSHGPEGHSFSYRRKGSAASKISEKDLPLTLLENTRYFHTSGISQAISTSACDAVFSAMNLAREYGAEVVYDSNLRLTLWSLKRAKAIIEASISLSDYFLPSLEDAKALTGLSQPEAILDWAFRSGARQVILKLGKDGVLASDGRQTYRIPPLSVSFVDATGAGDCFAGAFIARLSAGHSFCRAIEYANCAAGLLCQGFGAIGPLPRRFEVEARLMTTDFTPC